ncbi:uncharacterized protein CANTADRAFT_23421 [Suhomyces tanzawaensis NRRL Y-17324]|uniref:Uncharacterized protein n=1 Tax=Suhomyces tanzawaensis NRRL Y-17324 TaxID=984487 RepID=A0A1E4SCP8_9ASCO|nr:uncharacterized protein CANTADRAFT_23421 [Suhomyces tanzawaensis NRRL Y-17324]ODV77291.1 hypothetical protein CANTADRAFT_23421 [Suhomyces tanzawaensis NRRL Y-17324]
MSDLAFNNYCITCDQLCSHNSIYCSESCKTVDEQQSSHIIHRHEDSPSATTSEELVSPLLAPNMYQHYNGSQSYGQDLSKSPLLLPSNYYTTSSGEDSNRDLDYFDLNYSVQSNTNYALANTSASSELLSSIPSTSHNYRKWLTACL